jgi:hypothetical protein
MNTPSNALTITDGFSDTDPTESPLRGTSIKFKDGAYYAYGDKIDVKDKTYAVLDRVAGWQKLQKDFSPEYLMREVGQPKPPQPNVPKEEWPLDLNGQPTHPWRWTNYLYLLDTATGEVSTFQTNTIGGNVAIGALSDQVGFMRRLRPGAIPIIGLESRDMPTQYGGTKARPHFELRGWKERDPEQQNLLAAPEQKLVDVEAPSLEEQMGGDAVPFNDPVPHFSAAGETPKKKQKK